MKNDYSTSSKMINMFFPES